ncbi:CmpA/NrtA family ABC transporter substrate-binding protein [Azospirillum rugosum]|uniref:Nitrate/nitrite transport system substrate-binding protein n=1 Tax=Azospirillum rugosum TaxID=416170 RepID=A0ABS4SX57_9PROT|nr:CmpA/NrtA family ABC transporter substrate-binding protein [Azospirillum rugosum]MBP2297153.1 nitrate/nitrite transport system substrate-binding protein [Azospirillum rugosum]MDQ0528448.1 nitrate/nitrite transport system substrate-binding protein [Azospirillum rugosum]
MIRLPASPRTACFFTAAAIALSLGTLSSGTAQAAPLNVEKDQLKLGFIKLTDMAPLAIAVEKGFFDDEGLSVTLEPQANWKVLLDRVISGELDGAHMLAGQPLGATIGYGTQANVVTAFSMDLNGNGITVSNEVWERMKANLPKGADGKPVHPIKADALKPVIAQYRAEGKPFTMGMVFPVSTHNYELRYWLAAGGINPGFYSPTDVSGQIQADALLSVTPPPQMPATLEAGTIFGYAVGEPWNQAAVMKGIGVPVIADPDIWKNKPEKVFGVTEGWAAKNPNTHLAVVKALIRAAQWLDENNNANRAEAVKILAKSEYVGADAKVIANSMTGTFEYEKGDKRSVPDFNVFFRYNATYPFYSDAIWYLTQMRRWGQIAEAKPDGWYAETARKVYKPDVYLKAAKLLVEEGKAKEADFPWTSDGYKPVDSGFIDGIAYDGRKPNDYLSKLSIGLKGAQKVEGGQVVGAAQVGG